MPKRRAWVPDIRDVVTLIPLSQDKFAAIDTADLDLVASKVWSAVHSRRDGWYASCNQNSLSMHRLLMGEDRRDVDHIDGDGLNNRRSNLRWATRSQNNANQRPSRGGSSQYKGVSLDKGGKWFVKITCDGLQRYIGLFADEEEGARAYDAAALELWGEFAWLNFPKDKTDG